MEINWQDIFHITASITMIVIMIMGVYLLRLLFIASKILKNVNVAARGWGHIVEDITYFRKSIKLKILGFILGILDKKDQYE
jgi:hypothetical protein